MTEQELKEIDDIIFFIRNRNDTTDAGKAVLISLMENIRATLRERDAELAEAKKELKRCSELIPSLVEDKTIAEKRYLNLLRKDFGALEMNFAEDNLKLKQACKDWASILNQEYEKRTKLESTVARLMGFLKRVEWVRDTCMEKFCPICEANEKHGHEDGCQFSTALSPSPSANSGERDLKTEMEMWDSNAKVEDWRLQRYGECVACGGNLTADHRCHPDVSTAPSVSPGGIAYERSRAQAKDE